MIRVYYPFGAVEGTYTAARKARTCRPARPISGLLDRLIA